MSEEEKDIALLERYLAQELDAEEANRVQSRLASDNNFKQLLDELKILKAGFREAGRHALKEQLKNIEATLPEVAATRKVIAFRPWSIGIAAALVLAVITYLLWPSPADPQELFAQYFEPYPNIIMPTVRGDLPSDSSLTAKAFRSYDQSDFETALKTFQDIESKTAADHFYMANCFAALNRNNEALAAYQTSLAQDSIFVSRAQWYMALIYMKESEYEKCKEILNELVANKTDYANKAQQLLNHL